MNSINVERNRIEEFCRRWDVSEMALFGSAVRGDLRHDSDIDVLVVFKPEARIGLLGLARMERELSEVFSRKVDLVTRDGLKPRIRNQVLSEAEVLYAA